MRPIDADKIGLTDFEIFMCQGSFKAGLQMLLQKIDNAPTLDTVPLSVIADIRAEIEGNMESIIGKYDSSIPKFNMPSYKIERNKAREECISIIDKYKVDGHVYGCTYPFQELPEVDIEPKWIPVEEELPELGVDVLCQCRANIFEVLALTPDGWYHDEKHCYMMGFVIAWMPLPKPYEKEKT